MRLLYRFRYWLGKVFALIGFCRVCGCRVIHTKAGMVCSNCRKRY